MSSIVVKLDDSDSANAQFWITASGLKQEQVLRLVLYYAAAWAKAASSVCGVEEVQCRIAYGPWHRDAKLNRYVDRLKVDEIVLPLDLEDELAITGPWRPFVDPRPTALRPRDQILRCVSSVLIYFGLRELHLEDPKIVQEIWNLSRC